MSKKQKEKLVDFNRAGVLITTDKILATKEARAYVRELQEKKTIPDNWKLDIFIDKDDDSLAIGKIPHSAAYLKGKYEIGIFLNKYFCKGHPRLETKDQNCLIASFLTEEQALLAVPHLIEFISYRYNMQLKLVDELWKGTHE